jgi:hypothetical protein
VVVQGEDVYDNEEEDARNEDEGDLAFQTLSYNASFIKGDDALVYVKFIIVGALMPFAQPATFYVWALNISHNLQKACIIHVR